MASASPNNQSIDSAVVLSNIEQRRLPKDREEAKWCLQFMVTQDTFYVAKEKELQEYALWILHEYPDLAYSTFSGCYDQMDHPLLIFLRASPINSNVEAIHEIYEMYPEAVQAKTYQYTSDFALHIACQFEAGPGVIEFLAKEYPEALYEGNNELSRPINELLSYSDVNDGHLLELVQCFVELAPETIRIKDSNGRTPLMTAILMNKNIDVIKYLISKVPHEVAEFRIDSTWEDFTLDENAARSVQPLLNKLEGFDCRPPDWTPSGFSLLLSFLSKNRTIHKLQLELPGIEECSVTTEVKELLRHNNTMSETTLCWKQDDSPGNSCLDFFSVLTDGLKNNKSLRLLILKNIQMWRLDEFLEFVLSCPAPLELVLENAKVFESHVLHGPYIRSSSQVRSLKLVNCYLGESLVFLLQNLHNASSLKSLELHQLCNEIRIENDALFLQEGPFSQDISDGLIPLMQQANNIENISVIGYMLNFDHLCEVLRTNATLKSLTVKLQEDYSKETGHCAMQEKLCQALAVHNTTLIHADVYTEIWTGQIVEYPLLKYYTDLNLCGRGAVRDPSASKSQFVNLLPSSGLFRESGAILYGLLREAPSVWSSSGDIREGRSSTNAESGKLKMNKRKRV